MKTLLKGITLMALVVFFCSPVSAEPKEEHPGQGEGAVASNAPSTETQVKGEERAAEVGKGEKKGLENEPLAKGLEKKDEGEGEDEEPAPLK